MLLLLPILTALAGGGIGAALIRLWGERNRTAAEAAKTYAEAHSLILNDLVTEVKRLNKHIVVLETALRTAGVDVPHDFYTEMLP